MKKPRAGSSLARPPSSSEGTRFGFCWR
jgi:hypothetical protein